MDIPSLFVVIIEVSYVIQTETEVARNKVIKPLEIISV